MKKLFTVIILAILILGAYLAYLIYFGTTKPEFVQVDKISVSDVKLLPNPSFDLAAHLNSTTPIPLESI